MIAFDDTRVLMQRTVDYFKVEISAIRTGRAVPALVENIICQAYGGSAKLKVKELGTITTADSQTLIIQPWDLSVIGEIKQGILAANVGLTPVVDNNLIRISVPSLTQERRQEYVKLLHQKMEEARVAIRNVRQEKIREIRTSFEAKEISEDEKFKTGEDLQKITNQFMEQVEEIGRRKEQEIMTI